MRNVKRLWGIIGCLTVGILLLSALLITRSSPKPDQTQPQRTQPPSQVKEDERIVAKIGNRLITFRELQTALISQHGSELLNVMLDREALRVEGAEAGIQIEKAEIERELKRMQQGYESETQFYQSMKDQLGMSRDELKEDVHYKLLLERIATQNIPITDKQVDDYIKIHPDEFKSVIELSIAQIIVSSREQANKVIGELNKGADFAILARDRSIDDVTANHGGDLGWLEEGDPFIAEEIMNAAKMLKVGEYSKPITVQQGFAIVKLKDRRTKSDPNRSFIRDNVKRELALQKAPPLKDIVKKLREKWKAEIKDPVLQ
ncbi:peptidylprolyl isomerase [Paenibacillus sp. GP183]|uniref:peptidylprolyl isomerase n=1 Tax=Paenibacillus sp. GP183 TaxID=1882751 RepID=UPI000894AA90|nr:peptidylprolyl isomerase [Paenibacillus sp. GP183]SEC38339.1 foldase protein PrsA [Paenibacillus sp. GP183]